MKTLKSWMYKYVIVVIAVILASTPVFPVGAESGTNLLPIETVPTSSTSDDEVHAVVTDSVYPEYQGGEVLPDATEPAVTVTEAAYGTLVRYPFDGDADSEDGLNNATVSGSLVFEDGWVGQAISLNGSDSYVTLPSDLPSAAADEITVSTWVNWKGGNEWQRIFDFGNGTSQYMFLTPKTGNYMRFAVKDGGREQIVQTSQLEAGQWVHVAVTIGGGQARLYVNGEMKAEANMSLKPSSIKSSMNYLGKSQFADPLFNGSLDEFRIYNYALNANELQALYLSSSLDSAIERTKQLVEEGQRYYSDETWNRLLEVLERAEELKADPSATQTALLAIAAELVAAMQNLAEPLPVFINNTGTELVHPAVSVAPQELLRVREHILNEEQPWYGYYTAFASSSFASKSYAIKNDKDPAADFDHLVPNYSYNNYSTSLFNNQMTQDATAAYYQAVMYFMTGDSDYREKAMRIVLLWGSLDPSMAKYVTDAHIHQGPPMYMMNAAAELLRYTSTSREELEWKEEYSQRYSNNFQKPALQLWMERNTNWMNQHQTSVMATLSSYVFMDSKADYERILEWATVNGGTTMPYHNGAIANAMFEFTVDSNGNELPEPVIAIKEMVRDQPHSFDNIEGLAVLAAIISAQGTLLDPVMGTAANQGVDVYSFMNDRLIKGVNYFYKYNLGYDVPFNDGLNAPISPDRRGRLGGREDYYYIYKYGKGYTDNNPDFQYVAEAMYRTWEVYGLTVNDSWLYIPEAAKGTPVPSVLAQENGGTVPYQLETRFTPFDSSTVRTDDSVRIETSTEGSIFAVYGMGIWRGGDLALRIRSNGITTLELKGDTDKEKFASFRLPDTEGEWKYTVINLSALPATAFQADSILYFKISGVPGDFIELDHVLVNSTSVKAPTFKGNSSTLGLDVYPSAQLLYDVSNTAANAGQSLTYGISGNDESFLRDAEVSVSSTGVLTGRIPATQPPGGYSFYVTVSNETTIKLLEVTITVAGLYSDTIANVISSYNPAEKYETDGYRLFQNKYEAALALINSSDEVARNRALLELKDAVKGLRLLNPLLDDGALDLTGIAVGAPDSAGINMASLVDLYASGLPIRWIVDEKQFTIDFGTDFKVKPNSFRMLPDAAFPARSEGAVILASNDYTNWVRISDDISEYTTSWFSYTVKNEIKDTGFRYFRMKDITAGVLNKDDYTEDQPFTVADLHIFGERYETVGVVRDISLMVQNRVPVQDTLPVPPRAINGDKVILSFTADEPIGNIRATIQGETLQVKDHQNGRYTAEYAISDVTKSGHATLSLDYTLVDGTPADTVYSYTDSYTSGENNTLVSQKILVSNAANEIDVVAEAHITGSDNTLSEEEIAFLFDGKISTFPDVRAGGGGYGYYILDFGESDSSKRVQLDRIEILNRNGFSARAAGVNVSASIDGVNWISVSESSKNYSYDTWQSVRVLEQYKNAGFRYLRINGGNWYGNISELRLFGQTGTNIESYDPVYTVTTTANNPVAGTTIVYVNPNGLPPAPKPSGNEGSTLTVHGNLTAITVLAVPAPGYEFVKWVEPVSYYGLSANYLWTEYPLFNLTTYAGGYLGGVKSYNVTRDWNLQAVFRKIGETDPTEPTVAPGKPVLSDNNGYDTGLKDGNYTVTMNLWWGENGTVFKLYENGNLISTQDLNNSSPQAQTTSVEIFGKK